MPTKNRPLSLCLAACGLLASGLVAICLAQAPPLSQKSPVPKTVPHSILVLKDGRILRGPVTVDDEGYSILLKAGVLRYRRKEVEQVFATIDEVYEYKLARVPPKDPDEQLMLARWCLQEQLRVEAADRLRVVLELNPGNRTAENMLASIEAQAQKQVTRDMGVVQTQALAPVTETPVGVDKPNPINDIEIAKAAKAMGAVGTPVIFDLPPTVALKRYEEFIYGVQTVLLKSCAGCHNERYPGDFKLVQIRTKRDQNHLTFTTNLDATLRLVDTSNPAQSPLLTNALVPHGPSQKPVLRGPNDQSYQILSSWVRKIVTPTADPNVAATQGFAKGASLEAGSGQSGFGQDRPGVRAPLPTKGLTKGVVLPRNDQPVDPNFPVSPLMNSNAAIPKPIPKPALRPAKVNPPLPGAEPTDAGEPVVSEDGKSVSGIPAEIPPEMLPADLRNAPPLPKDAPTKKFKGKVDTKALENLIKRSNPGS